jgi:hypothetical protein
MASRYHPDTFYSKLPLRKITGRVTYHEPHDYFHGGIFCEHFLVLECGHEERDGGQKSKVRCCQCGIEQGVYGNRTEAQP